MWEWLKLLFPDVTRVSFSFRTFTIMTLYNLPIFSSSSWTCVFFYDQFFTLFCHSLPARQSCGPLPTKKRTLLHPIYLLSVKFSKPHLVYHKYILCLPVTIDIYNQASLYKACWAWRWTKSGSKVSVQEILSNVEPSLNYCCSRSTLTRAGRICLNPNYGSIANLQNCLKKLCNYKNTTFLS